MPYMELSCEDCKIYFELGTSVDIAIENIICVDCASPNIKVLAYETESHSRLAKVIEDVAELTARIEAMTDEDFGFDTPNNGKEPN